MGQHTQSPKVHNRLHAKVILLKSSKPYTVKPKLQKLTIVERNAIYIVASNDIVYCKSDSNYTHIITQGKTYITSKCLKEVTTQIDSVNFIRVHASYLVNLQKINVIEKLKGQHIILINGPDTTHRIPVSRTKIHSLKSILNF